MKGLSSHKLRRAGVAIRRYGIGFLAASALGFAPAAPAQDKHPQAQTFEEFLNGPEGAILDSQRNSQMAGDPVPEQFRRQLFAVAPQSQGRIGVAALDLTTGRTVSIQGNEPFPMASTSKIAVAATFLAGVDAGKYSLFDRYPLLVPVASEPFSSKVAPVRKGEMMSAQTLLERMITRSDNQATDALLAVVGGPQAVNEWVRKNTGLMNFRIDRDIATLVRDRWEFDLSRHVDVRDSTPPDEMVQLIAGIHQGKWLSPASRGLLVGAMTRTITGSTRIKAGLPSGTNFGHKTGTLNKTASDVGFITMPDGRVVVVAIYVTGQSGPAARNAKIAEITRTLYNGYASAPARHAANDNSRLGTN